MITTLIGDNQHLIDSKIKQLVIEFKKNDNGLAIEKIFASEVEFDDLKLALNAQSLFSDSRLVILDRPSLNKQFIESAEEIINSLPENTHLVIVEPSIDKRLSYYKLLLKGTNLIDCTKLDAASLARWIVERTKNLGGDISFADANYLIDRVGDDQLLIDHELEKLVIYDTKVSKASINLLSVESSASTVFQLLNAVFNDQPGSALGLYDKQRLAKEPPEKILAMFVWQLHLIAVCLSAGNLGVSEIASKTKINPNSLRNSLLLARKLSFTNLKRITDDLLDIDYLSKTVSFDLDQAMKNFILETPAVI